jgi:N-succinyl-L-ornithine transcarbamylase
MRHFTSVKDVDNIQDLVTEAIHLKKHPWSQSELGKNKTLGLIFLNPSLRTRLSTQRAGQMLGMNTMVMNFDKEGWTLETKDGTIMNGDAAEHVKEAAAVVGQYVDIIGIRSFPKLINREEDYADQIIEQFKKYSGVPVISLESTILHPCQSLADLMTIEELKTQARPKVVLTWAPHIKNLPQAVPNSFAEWMNVSDVDFVITHPEGYELAEQFSGPARVTHNQKEAFEGADFIYAKNWSSYSQYGQILSRDSSWMVDKAKMDLTNQAKFMHCLPVRRNLIVADEVIDSPNSVVIQQAGNRLWSVQAVLKRMLEEMK